MPQLIARLTPFKAFSVWLLDEKREDCTSPTPSAIPRTSSSTSACASARASSAPPSPKAGRCSSTTCSGDPRYIGIDRGRAIAAGRPAAPQEARHRRDQPVRRAGRSVHARGTRRCCGSSARTSRSRSKTRGSSSASASTRPPSRRSPKSAATSASILDLDQLLERIATLVHRSGRVSHVRHLPADGAVGPAGAEARHPLRQPRRFAAAAGRRRASSALPREHKAVVNVPDVTKDPRYIPWVEDCRSELAVPLLVKDRCIGVLDLESPNYDAFGKHDVEVLTLLASQLAVAIENARLYETLRANEERLENELSFARRVQAALLPVGIAEAPSRCGRGREVHAGARARRRPARLPVAGAVQPRRRRRRRVGQGRACRALQRLRRRADAIAHVPPPVHAGSNRRRPACCRR